MTNSQRSIIANSVVLNCMWQKLSTKTGFISYEPLAISKCFISLKKYAPGIELALP